MKAGRSYWVALALRTLVLLAPLGIACGGFVLFDIGHLLDLPVAKARRAEADGAPIVVGWVTSYALTRHHGLPTAQYRVNGDDFWFYELRTATDLQNAERLRRGDVELPSPARGPVAMEHISVLRFDGESRLLKAIHLR